MLGAWDDGRLVNTRGELFVANPAEAEEDSETPLPELSGPAGSERDVSARYLEFVNWFEHIALVPRPGRAVAALCVDGACGQRRGYGPYGRVRS